MKTLTLYLHSYHFMTEKELLSWRAHYNAESNIKNHPDPLTPRRQAKIISAILKRRKMSIDLSTRSVIRFPQKRRSPHD